MSKHSELLIDAHNLDEDTFDEDTFDEMLDTLPLDIKQAIEHELGRTWERAYLHGYWDADSGAECEVPDKYADYEGPGCE